MRVWLDILTPKQVLFFTPLIEELRFHGCEILATSRRYREIEPLARMQKLDLRFIGERGGGDPLEQLVASTKRQEELIPVVAGFKPHLSLSVASGVCARISFGLRIRHIAVNDSPHSIVAGKLSLPLSYHLLCPWIIPYREWAKFCLKRNQVTRYHALDPAAWLKRKPGNGPVPKLSPKKRTITVRLEESFAPYMAGTSRSLGDSVLKAVARGFPSFNLVVLCRYGEQLEHIKRTFGESYIVPTEVVDGRSLLEKTDLFVGMGGTMTTESALMGVPTISMFQGALYTEIYLASVRLLVKARTPEHLLRLTARMLGEGVKDEQRSRAKRVLDSMEDPVSRISEFLLATPAEG